MTDSPSFLPRIESVFYAVFDEHQGPKIVHQVPEGLIAGQHSGITSITTTSSLFTTSPTAIATPTPLSPAQLEHEKQLNPWGLASALSSPSLARLDSRLEARQLDRSQRRVGQSSRFLFNFDDVSKYIIPPSPLCGRVVKIATRNHRIIGFPVELQGRYQRNYFRYNLCFVFDKNADLSCYEPVVRKVSRVLTSCEEECAFLSGPNSPQVIHAILEQLYEDLNSYSETSIEIDAFNSIELKIFPFYPNPPPVGDWQVPLALINLTKRIEPNWDLTVAKVCHFIDGTNHVARIAHLADCDLDLTREAIAHLLYYQVIMMIDIFQYSNMYTLRKSVQWLADESHVREECGPYVTKPDLDPPDWPKLLHLYSRLKPGVTVFEWMEEYCVQELGIDVRRFTSFGVVKGFLRRVHRWPVLVGGRESASLQPIQEQLDISDRSRISGTRLGKADQLTKNLTRIQDPLPTLVSTDAESTTPKPTPAAGGPYQRQRKTSLAESSIEQVRTRDAQKFGDAPPRTRGKRSDSAATVTSEFFRRQPSTTSIYNPSYNPTAYTTHGTGYTQTVPSSPRTIKMSPDTLNNELVDSEHSSGGLSVMTISRPRLSRSPSAPLTMLQAPGPPYPPDLLSLLDGEHHTDELCTRFEVGWPVLEKWLRIVGGGGEEGDFGRVAIIYR